jgi:hypothetical protein
LAFSGGRLRFASNSARKNKMKQTENSLESDTDCVLEFLSRHLYHFISEADISRNADGERRFVSQPHWAHAPLSRLLALDMVEADASSNYRIKLTPSVIEKVFARKFISPEIKILLRHSGLKIYPECHQPKKSSKDY